MMKEIIVSMDIDLPAVKMLRAGALECQYESGNLRSIRHGETELIRMIYSAVRNEHWGTLPCTIQDEQIILHEAGFSIDYTAVYFQQGPVYISHFHIEGRSDNTIVFSMKGEALAAFQKNRIGLCVHHPVTTCSGRTALVTRPDGTVYKACFPIAIDPWQPFLEVQQMQWVTSDDKSIQLLFEGDIFETEDQRNWSDASFKTYSTPQRIPFPVSLQAGDKMEQTITLIVSGTKTSVSALSEKRYTEEKIPFPKIGYCRSGHQRPLTVTEAEWMHKIPFHHYRVVILVYETGWQKQLETAIREAILLHTQLELVAVFSGDYYSEAASLVQLLAACQQHVYSILVLQKDHNVTPSALLSPVYPMMKTALPGIQIGYGTDRFFAGLNRFRPQQTPFDFVSFSLHPQVHAFDTRTIFENLENQPDLVATARSFAAGNPVHISPVTLQDRYENNGPDKRQYTETAARWTLLSLQQLSEARSITYYELFGENGLLKINHDKNGNEVQILPSPVYTFLSQIHQFNPAWVIKRYNGGDILRDGLLLENENGERLFFNTASFQSF